MNSTLAGELRRLPPSTGVRILQALALWLFLKGFVHAFARYALGYRHRFTLSGQGRELLLDHTRTLWGIPLRTSRTLLPLDRLQEITLEKSGESAGFSAGLAALVMGTFLGARFVVEGTVAPGGAPWLLGIGTLLVVAGIAIDYFAGSGRSITSRVGSPQVVIRVRGDHGFVLSRLTQSQAQSILDSVQGCLSTGAPLVLPPTTAEQDGAPAQD